MHGVHTPLSLEISGNAILRSVRKISNIIGHARDTLRCYAINRNSEECLMADDDIEILMSARVELSKKRLSWAQTIANAGEIPDAAISGIVEVQHAIDVIDRAIEEEEEARELEDEEEE
jgi:hypothetical protein